MKNLMKMKKSEYGYLMVTAEDGGYQISGWIPTLVSIKEAYSSLIEAEERYDALLQKYGKYI